MERKKRLAFTSCHAITSTVKTPVKLGSVGMRYLLILSPQATHLFFSLVFKNFLL